MELTSAQEVVAALGGTSAAARLANMRSPQALDYWLKQGKLPPSRADIMRRLLQERGLKAPASLWGQE